MTESVEELEPWDAVHVATAVETQVAYLDTYDGKLIGLSGRIGDPPLDISKPGDLLQLPLDMDGGDEARAEESEDPVDDLIE